MIKTILISIMKPTILVGGQAVIEGVMMRVPGAYATAVRDPNGKIHVDRKKFIALGEKSLIWKQPILRGMAGLYESMKMGMETLHWSADIAMPDESQKTHPFIDILMTLLSILIAFSLFFAIPIGLTDWIFEKNQDAFTFNVLSGSFRIIFFLLYLVLISLLSDVKRLFQYHGAEHKTVYNFESGQSLNVNNAQSFPTQHPRCGTSFMFIIMIVAIVSFSIFDSIIMIFVGEIKVWMRLITHIPLIPLVAGIGYEVLKLTAKYQKNIIFKILAYPGLWLQNITTKIPDDDQVEVAIAALKSAFGDDIDRFTGKKFVAEAIG